MLGKTAFRGLLFGKAGLHERGGLRTQSLKIHSFWYINHLRNSWVASATFWWVNAHVLARVFKLFSVWRLFLSPSYFQGRRGNCAWSPVVVLGTSFLYNTFPVCCVAFKCSIRFWWFLLLIWRVIRLRLNVLTIWSLLRTLYATRLNVPKSAFCLQSGFLCFVWML